MVDRFSQLYPFVFRGELTQASLDKAGRKTKTALSDGELSLIREKLSFDMLDEESVVTAQRMALVYTAIHAFENTVRAFVKATLVEHYQENWWEQVPEKIKKKVASRMEDDAKFRWHGTRGGTEIEYCDFGDLSSVISVNWDNFELPLSDLEWAKSLLGVLERSRNIVMHGGVLAIQDIERIGGNIRDWVRQTG
ncbi:MAG: Swt1 family HEPN domain-containing protein [Pseudomonadota bacterium]